MALNKEGKWVQLDEQVVENLFEVVSETYKFNMKWNYQFN